MKEADRDRFLSSLTEVECTCGGASVPASCELVESRAAS
jgi:hypothetical protein